MKIFADQNSEEMRAQMEQWDKARTRGKIATGVVVITAGVLFLVREMGVQLPQWIFSWQMLLIAIGVISGVKSGFRKIGWLVLVLLGSGFLLKDFVPEWNFSRLIWPVAIIVVGLYILFRPKRTTTWKECQRWNGKTGYEQVVADPSDHIEINAVFSGVEKHVTSKTFKGGEVNAVFGGVELNLTQADIDGAVELEINNVFAGTRLVVPPHWELKSELSAFLGGVEDKRMQTNQVGDSKKVLVIKGNAVFGGIEIASY